MPIRRQPAIYLLTNKPFGVLYIGVTSNLPGRIWQHRERLVKGFTSKYNLKMLVYFELFDTMYDAIAREKQLKSGSRQAKIRLVESMNPNWRDLYLEICG